MYDLDTIQNDRMNGEAPHRRSDVAIWVTREAHQQLDVSDAN
jgi:hypothetical protein